MMSGHPILVRDLFPAIINAMFIPNYLYDNFGSLYPLLHSIFETPYKYRVFLIPIRNENVEYQLPENWMSVIVIFAPFVLSNDQLRFEMDQGCWEIVSSVKGHTVCAAHCHGMHFAEFH